MALYWDLGGTTFFAIPREANNTLWNFQKKNKDIDQNDQSTDMSPLPAEAAVYKNTKIKSPFIPRALIPHLYKFIKSICSISPGYAYVSHLVPSSLHLCIVREQYL